MQAIDKLESVEGAVVEDMKQNNFEPNQVTDE
jgi:hypothetical protein